MSQESKDSEFGGAMPDDTPARPAKTAEKVELDLDDAPFLAEDEPEPVKKPEREPARPSAPPVPAEAGPSLKDKLLANKKILIIAGAGVVVLIAAMVFLFSGEPEPAPAPAPAPETVEVRPQQLPPAEVSQFTVQFEPFWVEIRDTEGAIRFLTCRFTLPTENPVLFAEMTGKRLILRDALFYYLRNQPIISLSDGARVQEFKGELMTVLNEHLGSGKVNEILIEEYLIQ